MKKSLLFLGLTLMTVAAKAQFIAMEPMPNERIDPTVQGLATLELRKLQVAADIQGEAATTTLDQTFFNPSNVQRQGYYYFPIPVGGTIEAFSMFINGVETKGEVLDAAKARKIYEDIVRRSSDPALLEFYNQSVFRVKIFPILPNTETRLKMTYRQTLSKESGTIEYALPMRRIGAQGKGLNDFSVKINLDAKANIKTIYCPTHEAEIKRKSDETAVIGYEKTNLTDWSDFKVFYNTDKSKLGVSLLNFRNDKEDGYFMLSLSPGFAQKETTIAKDVVFVMDKSGSMSADKMDQARKALTFCVEHLNANDRFEVIPFSTEAESLFGKVETASADNVKKAKSFIKDINPVGGTNIDEALALALAAKTSEARPFFVVFLTDGKPTIGETSEDALLKKVQEKNTQGTRIFTFGIGADLNTHLLDKLTDASHAWRTYITEKEDIEIKISDFYTKIASPVLTDIKVSINGVKTTEVYPKELPDLFKGSTLTILGRYRDGGKATVTIEGKVNGKTEKFDYEINFEDNNTKNDFVPDLWAARSVGYLLDQIRLHGESKELTDEIVRLAKKHGIITPYTSYLIIEDEATTIRQPRPVTAPPRPAPMPMWRMEGDLGLQKEDIRSSAKDKVGETSVRTSTEVQDYSNATNLAESKRGQERVNFTDDNGNTRNISEATRNVQGRAFYLNGVQWNDANLLASTNNQMKTRRMKFNSDDYFKFLSTNSDNRDILALGRNVRFVMNDEIIEIYE